MEAPLLRTGFRRALAASCPNSKRQVISNQRRWLATPMDTSRQSDPFSAAPPIRFNDDPDQFTRSRVSARSRRPSARGSSEQTTNLLMKRIRIVPASPSYFTATPRYTDDLLALSALLRKYQLLPQLPPGRAPRVAWKTFEQYRSEVDEPVRETRYSRLLELVKRLNYIHPDLMPAEVPVALGRFKRTLQPFLNKPKPILIDEYGRARAAGRRKSSSASVYVVEGDGECMINGRSLTDYFGRLQHREKAMWPLKATERIDKYNIWATASGGGNSGQADAVMLAVAKGLMAHEPALKPALRRAGCVTRDPRRVERKKPGKLKARKMPAWVKR